ncbi:CSMD3-like protein [Mya arenaria]|uniref:CSMD3-like protein n=1 Tax=Mya arenaria TaxID=6604 RepID=A0ABY7EI90_MYAAR|nr:CSMD3-like protein [Mya arenaria]
MFRSKIFPVLILFSILTKITDAVLFDGCTIPDDCAATPNSVCDTVVSGSCVCSAAQGFVALPDNSGCYYDCGALTPPTDGTVTVSDDFLTATYTCNSGFQLNGNVLRNCVSGAGDIDNCSPNPCAHGTCTDLVNDYTCACVAGYDGKNCDNGLLGDDCSTRPEVCANIQNSECASGVCACVSGYLKTDTAVCSRIDCGTLSPQENGAVNHGEGTLYQAKAYFSCDTGYIRIGLSSVQCLANGSWDACPTIDAPLNGTVVFLPNAEYQGNAEFACNVGFSINGATARTCMSTGTWNCGPLTAPANGVVTQSGTVYTSIGQYECDSGYDLQGAQSVTCTAAATWSAPRPTCAIKDCGALTAPQDGTVDASAGTTFGASAVFSCNTGYQAIGTTTLECLDTGVWSDVEPTCEIKDNGSIDISGGTTYDSVAIYTCNAGFDINGVNQRTCRADQTWSNLEPTCDRISCGTLISPTFGTVDLTAGVLFDAVAQFSCNEGYTLNGVTSRTCQADASWSGASPTCTIKSNGQVLTVDGTTAGATAQYSCDLGYSLAGLGTRTCSMDGVWTGSPPTCGILDCGPVASIQNGAATYDPGTLYGSTVFYTCDAANGYGITGVSSRVCLATGSWSGSQPSCNLLVTKPFGDACTSTSQCVTSAATCRMEAGVSTLCPTLPEGNLLYGSVIFPDIPSAGQIAVYSCDAGYALSGPALRTCLTSGIWSGTEPECTFGCPMPDSPENGYVNVSDGMVAGNKVVYSCKAGYTLVGVSERICEDDSTWSGLMPSCAKECPELPGLEHGYIDMSAGTWEGAQAVYVCEEDYGLVGESTRTCQYTGQWGGKEPRCLFAIFPDIILALGSLFIFLVLVDVFIVIFYFFNKHRQAKEAEFDRLEKQKKEKENADSDSDDDSFNIPAPRPHVGPYNARFDNRPRMYSPSPSEASSTHPLPKKTTRSKVIRGRASSAIKSIFSKGRKYEQDIDENGVTPYGATVFPQPPDTTYTNGDGGYQTANSEDHNESLDSSFEENRN